MTGLGYQSLGVSPGCGSPCARGVRALAQPSRPAIVYVSYGMPTTWVHMLRQGVPAAPGCARYGPVANPSHPDGPRAVPFGSGGRGDAAHEDCQSGRPLRRDTRI
jgi:hypothetical protein